MDHKCFCLCAAAMPPDPRLRFLQVAADRFRCASLRTCGCRDRANITARRDLTKQAPVRARMRACRPFSWGGTLPAHTADRARTTLLDAQRIARANHGVCKAQRASGSFTAVAILRFGSTGALPEHARRQRLLSQQAAGTRSQDQGAVR